MKFRMFVCLVLCMAPGCPTQAPLDFVCDTEGTGCGPFFLGPIVPVYLNCFPLGPEGPVVCFTCPCNVHDLCYSTCGTFKPECDSAFLSGMLAECDLAAAGDELLFSDCQNRAYVYAALVMLAGDLSFSTGQGNCEDGVKGAHARLDISSLSTKGLDLSLPFVDEDQDLLPDDWEIVMGLDPRDPADNVADYDGDGLSNLAEYMLNRDPLTPDADGAAAGPDQGRLYDASPLP